MVLFCFIKVRWESIKFIGCGLCNNVFYEEMMYCKFISLVGLYLLFVKLCIVYLDLLIYL